MEPLEYVNAGGVAKISIGMIEQLKNHLIPRLNGSLTAVKGLNFQASDYIFKALDVKLDNLNSHNFKLQLLPESNRIKVTATNSKISGKWNMDSNQSNVTLLDFAKMFSSEQNTLIFNCNLRKFSCELEMDTQYRQAVDSEDFLKIPAIKVWNPKIQELTENDVYLKFENRGFLNEANNLVNTTIYGFLDVFIEKIKKIVENDFSEKGTLFINQFIHDAYNPSYKFKDDVYVNLSLIRSVTVANDGIIFEVDGRSSEDGQFDEDYNNDFLTPVPSGSSEASFIVSK